MKPFVICFVIIAVILGSAHMFVNYFRPVPVENVNLAKVEDGSFRGTCYHGYFTFEVETDVRDHAIVGITILKNKTNRHAKKAEDVLNRVMREQTLLVDAVSGASTSSSVLLKATQNALQKGLRLY